MFWNKKVKEKSALEKLNESIDSYYVGDCRQPMLEIQLTPREISSLLMSDKIDMTVNELYDLTYLHKGDYKEIIYRGAKLIRENRVLEPIKPFTFPDKKEIINILTVSMIGKMATIEFFEHKDKYDKGIDIKFSDLAQEICDFINISEKV